MDDLVVRYLHFISFIFLAAMLVVENVLMTKVVSIRTLKKLVLIDAIYGISALCTLATGLCLWLMVGKPSEIYTDNPTFHLKVTLFIGIAVISFFPTVFILKNRKSSSNEIVIPAYLRIIKKFELLILLFLPLLGVYISRAMTIF
ncbi:DUF2214 family protein (plasmid) [Pseudoalteromonas sp. T1lg65]|uniref:DUF2214 family protein n=1 Tax=Pseudoalteromonas sp. T1lg65 TaxID=2077101 RepID=UPI003F79DBB0